MNLKQFLQYLIARRDQLQLWQNRSYSVANAGRLSEVELTIERIESILHAKKK